MKNYRKFRNVNLEFGDGVIGILGQNGAGKSSLLESVAWAIYGNESSIVRDGKSGVRWSGAGPNEECSVTLEFDLETDHYRLVRTLKGSAARSDAVLLVNGQVLAQTEKAVTETMESRLGMDHKAFFISIFARQKELNALSTLRPADRKKLVLRMLGIDVLDSVVDEISRDAREMKDELERLGRSLLTENGEDKVGTLRSSLEMWRSEHSTLAKEIDIGRGRILELDTYVVRARAEMEKADGRSQSYQTMRTKVAELEMDRRNRQARSQQIVKEITSLDEKGKGLAQLESAELEHRGSDQRRELLEEDRAKHVQLTGLRQLVVQKQEELKHWEDEAAQVEKDLSVLGNPEEKVTSAEEAIARYDEIVLRLREESSWCIKDRVRLEQELAEKREKRDDMVRLGPDSLCPTCERKMDQQHDMLLHRTERQMKDLEKTIGELDERKRKAEESVRKNQERKAIIEEKRREALKAKEEGAALRSKLAAGRSNLSRSRAEMDRASKQIEMMGPVKYDPKEHDDIKRRLAVLRPMVDQLMRLRTELQRRPILEKDKVDMTSVLARLEIELQAIQAKMGELNYSPEELSASRARYAEARDRKDEAERSLAQKNADRSGKESSIRAAEARLEELEQDVARIDVMRDHHMQRNVLLTVMRDFRANVMSRIVPTLSASSSELFTELTDGKYGGMELDDDYEVHIYDNGEKYPLSRFSGGESDLANLCLRLAISRLIAERSGKHINFLVLDEIFGSQDNVRKRNILNMLASLQRQFGQIMLITHIEDVKDAVDELVVVKELTDGSSVAQNGGFNV